MQVRECQEESEYFDDEDAGDVIFQCPVCSDVWLAQNESVGACQHIRFVYCHYFERIIF
jgi:hypothetical protein